MINTTAGILTATFLGFEAIDTDTFTFTRSSGTLSNKGALNATIAGSVAAGVDADYDDMVVGLKVAAIPEPETYALLLAGLDAAGFVPRRRRLT